TKGDFYAHKSMEIRTEIGLTAIARHEVTLRYEMPNPVDDIDRHLNPGDGSYRDYVRFYLPETANVANFVATIDGQPSNVGWDAITHDHGHAIVGAFFRLPRGHSIQVSLVYQVPLASASQYDL